LHLSRLGREGGVGVVEPSDKDTAEYIYDLLPSAWRIKHGVSMPGIVAALQEARDKNPGVAFEERVAQALAAMGPPP